MSNEKIAFFAGLSIVIIFVIILVVLGESGVIDNTMLSCGPPR